MDLRFPGQVLGTESGLHSNWHRYYDPGNGRYTQFDPIGIDLRYRDADGVRRRPKSNCGDGIVQVAIRARPMVATTAAGSWNPYAYVGGKPTLLVDPSGLREYLRFSETLLLQNGLKGYFLCLYRCAAQTCPGTDYVTWRWGCYDIIRGCPEIIED